jgi:hypothetical protein
MAQYARKCPVKKKSFDKNHNNGQGQKPQPLDKIHTKPEGARRNSVTGKLKPDGRDGSGFHLMFPEKAVK